MDGADFEVKAWLLPDARVGRQRWRWTLLWGTVIRPITGRNPWLTYRYIGMDASGDPLFDTGSAYPDRPRSGQRGHPESPNQ